MRKPAAFPHFPRPPPIIRYTLIRPQSSSIGSYLRGSSRRGGSMCVGLLSAADTYYSTTLILTTSGTPDEIVRGITSKIKIHRGA